MPDRKLSEMQSDAGQQEPQTMPLEDQIKVHVGRIQSLKRQMAEKCDEVATLEVNLNIMSNQIAQQKMELEAALEAVKEPALQAVTH